MPRNLDLPLIGIVAAALVVALVVALVATPVVKNLAIRVKAVDVPKDGRRMHDHPIPRMGGLAIFLGFLLSVLLFLDLNAQMRGMLLGAVIIVVLGIFDDIYSLRAMFKFVVQIIAALVAVLSGNVINYKYLKGHIVQDLVTGFTSSINPLLLTAALMGFASVVNACAGFQYFMNFAMMLADKMNPYISAVIVTNVFSGITGASLSGTQIFCSTMADQFMSLGTVNPQALYKVVGMAAMGMDTLPHCPTFVMEAQVCGVTTKESYPHVLVMTVITPIALALIAATMAIIGLI